MEYTGDGESDNKSGRKVTFQDGLSIYNLRSPVHTFRMKVYYSEAVCDGALKTFSESSMASILSPSSANSSNFINNVRKKLAYIGLSPKTKLTITAIPLAFDMSIDAWLTSSPGAAFVISPESESDALYHRQITGRDQGYFGGAYHEIPTTPRCSPLPCRTCGEARKRWDADSDRNANLQRELDHIRLQLRLLEQQDSTKDATIRSLEEKLSETINGPHELLMSERSGLRGAGPCSRSSSPTASIIQPNTIRHRSDECLDVDFQIRDLQGQNARMRRELEHMSLQVANLEQQEETKEDTIRALERKLGECCRPQGAVPENHSFEKMNASAAMKEVYRRMFLNTVRNKVRGKLARAFPSPPGKTDFLTAPWSEVLKMAAEIRDLPTRVGLDKVTLKVTVEDIANTRQLHGNTGIHIGIYADVVLGQDPLHRPAYKKLFRFLYDQDPETVRNNLISSWT